MKHLKVFLLSDSFQTAHHAQVLAAGMDPAWACVCREVMFPDDVVPPTPLIHAARFAEEAPVGRTMVVDPQNAARQGRRPIVAAFSGKFTGKPMRIRYLVGFTDPHDPREITIG